MKLRQKLNGLSSFINPTNLQIQVKLILPYLFLTFILALFGIILISNLVSKSSEERFYSQLLASAETAGEAFKYREADQLAVLRAMIYTEGVGQALENGDTKRLYQLLLPLKINSDINLVKVLDLRGEQILGILDKNGTSQDKTAAFGDISAVMKVLRGQVVEGRDKFAFIYQVPQGESILYTVGPVKIGERQVGAVLVGTHLSSFLTMLKSQSLADVTFYDRTGQVLGTTIPSPSSDNNVVQALRKSPTFWRNTARNSKKTYRETIETGQKRYDLVYSVLNLAGETDGFFSVALRDKFFMEAKNTTTRSMIIFFTLGMLLVSALGYVLARYITNPILHLVGIAKKIGKGDLTQRAQVEGKDEIGLLASTLNKMSSSIEERTEELKDKIEELTVLYQSSRELKNSLDLQSIYESVTKIFSQSFKVSTLLLLELDKNEDFLTVCVARCSGESGVKELIGKKILNLPEFQIHESIKLPVDQDLNLQSRNLNDEPVSIQSPLLIPLRTKGRLLGLIVLSDPEEEMAGWVNAPLLSAVGSEVAVAIENAHLYRGISHQLAELSSLQRVGEAITSSLRLEQIIRTVVSQTKDVVGADNVALILVNPTNKELEVKTASGPEADVIGREELEKAENITSWVLEMGAPVLLSDKKQNRVPLYMKRHYHKRVKDLVAVPLKAEGKTIGVLNVSNKIDSSDFTVEDIRVLSTLASGAALSIKNAYLYQDVRTLFLSSIKSLVSAIDQKDPYTHGHSERVATFSLMISEALGLDRKETENLEIAALLHDVGKIGIPENILCKPSRLNEDEEKIVREHPVKGVKIMEPMMDIKEIIPGMLYHHERYDGLGYPEGIKGLDIPLQGRIITVADSFDAMTSDRPYRKGKSFKEASKIIEKGSGTQFDPMVVSIFVKIMMQPIRGQKDSNSPVNEKNKEAGKV